MAHRIILVLIFIISFLRVFSQVVKTSEMMKPVGDPVKSFYYISLENEVVRHTSLTSMGGKELSGPYKGFENTTFNEKLVFSDGYILRFLNSV